MPVNRLKLIAFSLGAAIAGLTGCIFAAVATGVAAGAFDVSLLILVYAIVILGGAGSLTGVLDRRDPDQRHVRDPHARHARHGARSSSSP